MWLSVDGKLHENLELLLTVKLDEFGQISHINHISASSLEKPLSSYSVHGVVAPDDGKQRPARPLSTPLLLRPSASVELRRAPVAAARNLSKRLGKEQRGSWLLKILIVRANSRL